MKFVDGIKLGASFYIGWTIMKSLDVALGKTKPLQMISERSKTLNKSDVPKQEKNIIGFHM